MKLFISAFVLVVTLTSISVFAANATRKPSSDDDCGTKKGASNAALLHAEHDTGSKNCKLTDEGLEGPTGQFFHTYHVTFNCDGKTVSYDSETHEVGIPGKLACSATVTPAGAMEAH